MRARILDETRGNPLALIELPRGLTPAELAGGFGLPDARPLASRIEHTFLQRVQTLPRDTQLLLLTAAGRAAGRCEPARGAPPNVSGSAPRPGRPAEAAGLIELGARVRFPHPLVRSAVYRASDPSDRRDVHRALADVDRPGPRSRPARVASRARDGDAGRGGGRGDGALGRPRAAPWRAGRGRRVPAAGGRADAGPRHAGRALARRGPGEARRRRRRVRVRRSWPPPSSGRSTSSSARGWSGCGAQIAFTSRRGRDAPPLLLEAARRLDPLDAAMARETYLEAIASAMFAGRLGTGPDEREVAEAARASQPRAAPGAADLLLDAPRDAVHRGLRGVGRAALAGAARVRRTRRRRSGPALAVAGVPPRAGSLGRRALARARDPRRARRARHRRAQPARECAQLPRRLQRPFRGLRHCRGADRRGRCDHAGDRTPAAQVRGVHAGRVARRSARRCRRSLDHSLENATARGEGSALGLHWALDRAAAQRPRPATARRSRPRGRRASTRTSWRTAGRWSS